MMTQSSSEIHGNTSVLLVCIISLFLFSTNLYYICPTVYWLDSGEMSASLISLGLPHSPSFPAFVNTNYLIKFLPFGDGAFRTNIVSILWTCISCIIFFNLMQVILSTQSSPRFLSLLIGCWSLFVFTNPQILFQTVKVEVYSMNLALNLAVLRVLFALVKQKNNIVGGSSRHLFFLVLIVAFSACNHLLLSAHLWPAVAIWMFLYGIRPSIKVGFVGVLFGLLTGSIYLFLPIRSAQNPPMDIGNPEHWVTFINGVTRRGSFDRFFGNSWVEWLLNLDKYYQTIQYYISVPLMCVAIASGFLFLLMKKKEAIALWIIVITNISVTVLNRNFNINPDTGPAYLLISTTVLLSFPLLAIVCILDRWSNSCNRWMIVLVPKMLLLSLSMFALYHIKLNCSSEHADLSADFSAAWLGRGIFDSVHADGVIFTGYYSNYRFVLDYLTIVERYRDDVEIIDRGEAVYWPGGLQQVLSLHPEWKTNIHNTNVINEIEYLAPRGIRHSGKLDRIHAQRLITSLLARLAHSLSSKRPVYWFPSEDDTALGDNVNVAGLMLQVAANKVPLLFGSQSRALDVLEARIHLLEIRNESMLITELIHGMTNLGNSLDNVGLWHDGMQMYQRALKIEPGYYFAQQQLEILKKRRSL